MPTEAIKIDTTVGRLPTSRAWGNETHSGTQVRSKSFTLTRNVNLEAEDEIELNLARHTFTPQKVAAAEVESLEAVVLRVEDGCVYLTAKRLEDEISLRMSEDLFPDDTLSMGTPVVITLNSEDPYKRLHVARRDVEPVASDLANELLAWVNAL